MPTIPEDDPTLTLYRVIQEDGSVDPTCDPKLSRETALQIYRYMVLVRRLDERMMMRQRQGKVGFYGSITGQEATPIATAFATRHDDWIFPALRENSIMLVRGFPLERWLAQVYGNEADLLKGRQMPSHMSGRQVHQVAWSSCIGPQLPQAVGAAWAARLKGDDIVTVGFMGDGATSQGDFHAAMNFAGVYRVPTVLICQNNHWSISVPSARQTASPTFAVKAHAYGVPGVRVDGNDALALYAVVRQAVERARQGEGPTFVEALTYRIGPHSSSDDPSRYRSDEEVEQWRTRCPIRRMKNYLQRQEWITESEQTALEAELDESILRAIRAVEDLPPPARSTLFDDVYQESPWHLQEQQEELLQLPQAEAH